MIRRYIYDSRMGSVVELSRTVRTTTAPGDRYADAEGHWRQKQDDSSGQTLRHAALERAERRQFAHRKYGDEGRWAE